MPDQRPLTDRERRVLALLADGHTKAAIAAQVYLSVNGVKKTCERVYRKLGAHTAAQAVAVAYQRGLLVPDGDVNVAQTETDLAVVRTLRMPGYRLALARTEEA